MNRSPLISAEELRPLLNRDDVVVLDARAGTDLFAASHLRGALHADLNRDLSDASKPDFDPVRGGRHPLPSIERWAATVGRWGVSPDTAVIVYDQSDGSNAAARAWWMLRSIGHEDVRLLDGGFEAALAASLPVEGGVAEAPAGAGAYPVTAWQRPTVTIDRVDALRRSPEWKVLDVRSAPRYRGETEPIDPIAGHIPGALNLFFGENMNEGRFKSPEALRLQYETLLGDTPAANLIVHCGSGVTACHTLLALEVAGLEGSALYNGSWSEWCRSERPREP